MIINNHHIKQVLMKSGWYEDRVIDTSQYVKWMMTIRLPDSISMEFL